MLNSKFKSKRGFSLLEVMIGVAVFLLFAVGIYSGIQYVFKVVYQSRLRILETAILNEQIEIIRNLSFFDVGIVNGSPAGVLERTVNLTRNGLDFTITRTIRNIDDPYDGLIGGEPNDTAPADYKLVQVEIICQPCGQRLPYSLTTYLAPKFLEGDPNHGALFIEVFDANAQPVPGALVHIAATSTDPAVDFYDTTDNDGMLRIVDLGQGIQAYDIVVSKTGYTTDQTLRPTDNIPNPVKLPASVAAQDVTEISFAIDSASTLELNTINQYCGAIGNVPVNLWGGKLLGVEPDILKVDQNIITNGNGDHVFNGLEWDAYGLRATGYDLLGAIPILPLSLPPGAVQPVKMILGADTANSILVNAQDSVTGQPVSNAQVRVFKEGYDQTRVTGIGFSRQTDWSGGAGQWEYLNQTRYWAADGKIENFSPAGDVKLIKVGDNYVSSGWLESSVFDLGTGVNFVNLNWEPLGQPLAVGDNSVRWQIATSDVLTPETWNYLGSDGTANTYYNEENFAINAIHDNDQYFRYQLFLSTASTTYTPIVSDLTVTYTTSCTPPGQAYFGNLANQEYTVEVTAESYQPVSQTITPAGDIIFGFELVAL